MLYLMNLKKSLVCTGVLDLKLRPTLNQTLFPTLVRLKQVLNRFSDTFFKKKTDAAGQGFILAFYSGTKRMRDCFF